MRCPQSGSCGASPLQSDAILGAPDAAAEARTLRPTVAVMFPCSSCMRSALRLGPLRVARRGGVAQASRSFGGDAAAARAVGDLHATVLRDEGGRGVGALRVPGDLLSAAGALLAARHVAVLSGFPCVPQPPHAETDGWAGAAAVARAALLLGKKVSVVTDDACAPAARAVARHCELGGFQVAKADVVVLPRDATDESGEVLRSLAAQVDHVVAIERIGPADDGEYYTMSGRPVSDLVCHGLSELPALVKAAAAAASTGHEGAHDRAAVPQFTCIGDGGNELGMGKVAGEVAAHVAHGERIACSVAADHLVAATVSNWGAYALTASAAVLLAERQFHDRAESRRLGALVSPMLLLPTVAEEAAVMEALMHAGICDGVSRKSRLLRPPLRVCRCSAVAIVSPLLPWSACAEEVAATMDGLPFDLSLRVVTELRQAVASFIGSLA